MRRLNPEAGFTLVEILAACAVLSAIVLCSMRAWSVVDQLSFDLQLRQKAVFALNGEAERLSALYTVGGFNGSSSKPSGPSTLQPVSGSEYPALAGITGSANRLTYATSTTGPGFLTGSASTFAANSSSDSLVWVSGSGASTQDFVWLDRPRTIMARLSWVACPLSAVAGGSNPPVDNTAAVCWGTTKAGVTNPCFAFDATPGGTPCILVTVVLDYPYRLTNGAAVNESQIPGSHLTAVTLTLSTIVGRRS